MKRLTWLVALGLVAVNATGAAEERFSQAVRPEDFTAAGLGKLSPAELEKLDALIKGYRETRVAAETAAAKSAGVAVEASGSRSAKATKEEGGFLSKAKVILMPGTEVEYSTVESRLVGEFRGWDAKTTFTLENGQRWRVNGSDGYVGPPIQNPAVKIAPGVLGTFWMSIEGVSRKVKVTHVAAR